MLAGPRRYLISLIQIIEGAGRGRPVLQGAPRHPYLGTLWLEVRPAVDGHHRGLLGLPIHRVAGAARLDVVQVLEAREVRRLLERVRPSAAFAIDQTLRTLIIFQIFRLLLILIGLALG